MKVFILPRPILALFLIPGLHSTCRKYFVLFFPSPRVLLCLYTQMYTNKFGDDCTARPGQIWRQFTWRRPSPLLNLWLTLRYGVVYQWLRHRDVTLIAFIFRQLLYTLCSGYLRLWSCRQLFRCVRFALLQYWFTFSVRRLLSMVPPKCFIFIISCTYTPPPSFVHKYLFTLYLRFTPCILNSERMFSIWPSTLTLLTCCTCPG